MPTCDDRESSGLHLTWGKEAQAPLERRSSKERDWARRDRGQRVVPKPRREGGGVDGDVDVDVDKTQKGPQPGVPPRWKV